MSETVVKLRLESGEYDNKIKRAADALNRYADGCRKAGGTLEVLDDEMKDVVKNFGSMATSATSARGKLSELTQAFTDLSLQYKKMSDVEKNSPVGKEWAKNLDQLKQRIKDTKKDISDINKELNGGKFGQFGGLIDSLGKKMGVTGNLTEILTSKTALMAAGVGAAAAAIYKGTEAWMKYNAEVAKQDQMTTVVTGLNGMAANVMTDKMRAVVATYKVDFRQAIEAANTLMSQFGETGENATQLIKDGMQGMLHGDGQKLLQMIQQYAPAFRDAGVSASQLIAVIHNSQGGIFTAENMNAIVMGIKNIRLMTKQTSEALDKLGLDGQEMTKKMNDGSLSVFEALKMVAGKLKDCEAGSKTTGEVMQAVFGRSGVTAGQNLAKAIEGLNTNLEETKKQTGDVGEAFAELQTAYEGLNTAIRETFGYEGYQEMATGIKTDLVNALSAVIEKLGNIKALLWGMSPTQAKKQNHDTTGIPDEVQRDLEELRNAPESERERLYMQQRVKYEKRYGQAARDNQQARGWMNSDGENWFQRNNPLALIGRWWFARNAKSAGSKVAAEADTMKDYNKAARDIVYSKREEKVDVEINPTNATEKLKQLNEQLRVLKKQREDARSAGDIVQLKTLNSQINSVESDIKLLRGGGNGNAGGTSTEKVAKELNPLQQVQKDISTLTEEALTADADRLEIIREQIALLQTQAQEYKNIQDMVSGKFTTGAGGKPDYITSMEQEFKLSPLQEAKNEILKKMYESSLQTDQTTFSTLLQSAVQSGIDSLDPDFASLQEKMAEGMDIPDEAWQKIIDEYNELRKAIGEKPIEIDFKTGSLKSEKKEEQSSFESGLQDTQKVVSGLSSVSSGLQQLGVKLPEGVQQFMSGIQGLMSIINGVTSIIQVFNTSTATAQVAATTTNTAMLGALTAAVSANTAALGIQSAFSLLPFATGGVVHAANGFVPGNNHTDDIPVMVSSGELILNRAQQGNLASQMEGGQQQSGSSTPYVCGEQIYLGLTNYLRRSGRGELLTAR